MTSKDQLLERMQVVVVSCKECTMTLCTHYIDNVSQITLDHHSLTPLIFCSLGRGCGVLGHHCRTHLPFSWKRGERRLYLNQQHLVSFYACCLQMWAFRRTSDPEAEREAFVGAKAVGDKVNLYMIRVGEQGRGRRCATAEGPLGSRRGLNLGKIETITK